MRGRKPSGRKTVTVRVDVRLLPYIAALKKKFIAEDSAKEQTTPAKDQD